MSYFRVELVLVRSHEGKRPLPNFRVLFQSTFTFAASPQPLPRRLWLLLQQLEMLQKLQEVIQVAQKGKNISEAWAANSHIPRIVCPIHQIHRIFLLPAFVPSHLIFMLNSTKGWGLCMDLVGRFLPRLSECYHNWSVSGVSIYATCFFPSMMRDSCWLKSPRYVIFWHYPIIIFLYCLSIFVKI